MKKYFIIALATFSLFLGTVKAYVRVDSNVGVLNPKQYDIRNYEKEWAWASGATFSSRDPWLYSISDFSYLGGANGSYLNVNADYYFGIRTETSDSDVASYLNSDLNTLKSSNLRCGVGDYLLNYDSSFSPEIKNFNVNLVVNNSVNSVGSRQLLYHVTFSYSQQIKEINKNSTNVWCSFVREPSNGLFAQPVVESSIELRYYYYVNNMSYSVTKDKVVSAINDLQKEQQKTNDTLTSEDSDVTSKKCGVICKLKGIFTGIIELPSKIVNGLIDALKSLFVPTDEQLYEIVNNSKDLSENFGFVGESVNFFIDIFTSLLGMVNANGCIELPAFKMGATSLFDEHTFWEARQTCLADNVILSANIDTIRTITSIVFVSLFLGFASRKFFSILSKESNNNDVTDSMSNSKWI